MTEFENDTYINVIGIVAWDSETRELPKSGDTIRTFTIETVPEGAQLKATLWKELAHVQPAKGDFVAVRGKYTVASKEDKVYQNISVSSIAVLDAAIRVEEGEEATIASNVI
jgi:hypothetical protein